MRGLQMRILWPSIAVMALLMAEPLAN